LSRALHVCDRISVHVRVTVERGREFAAFSRPQPVAYSDQRSSHPLLQICVRISRRTALMRLAGIYVGLSLCTIALVATLAIDGSVPRRPEPGQRGRLGQVGEV